jgi:GAF domain-containing protein
MDLEKRLIGLVDATRADGGKALRGALREDLQVLAPFDRGEVAFLREGRVDRWRLDDGPGPVSGDDLVRHIAAHPVTVRLDDLHDAEPFPGTLESLEALGLRSLLALPLSTSGGLEGALVVARDYGWAFAGASLRVLVPLAEMAGLCVDRALQLTASGARPIRSKPSR